MILLGFIFMNYKQIKIKKIYVLNLLKLSYNLIISFVIIINTIFKIT